MPPMRPPCSRSFSPWARVVPAALLALAALSCAPVPNFSDPLGPGLLLRYAPARADTLAGPRDIRIVTFNLKFAEKIDEAIELFRENPRLRGADVVALQEMDDLGVDRLARSLKMNGVYYAASIHPSNRKNFGPALLTPWPVENTWKVILPHEGHARGQRRTATGAMVRIGGRLVRVYSVHLETPLRMGEGKRRDQVREILKDAEGWSGPMVVAGDMNDDEIVSTFEEHSLVWANCDAGPSLGPLAYDHVFLRGFVIPGTQCGVEDPQGASDHRPVWVVARSFQ